MERILDSLEEELSPVKAWCQTITWVNLRLPIKGKGAFGG